MNDNIPPISSIPPEVAAAMEASQRMFLIQPGFVIKDYPVEKADPDREYKLSDMIEVACSKSISHNYQVQAMQPSEFYTTQFGELYCVCPLTAVLVHYQPNADWGCLKYVSVRQGLQYILGELRKSYPMPDYNYDQITSIAYAIHDYDHRLYDWDGVVEDLREKGL